MAFQVVYCGGCNLTYDRIALVRGVERLLGEPAVYDSGEGILVLYVSGCQRRCVRGDGIAVFQSQQPEEIIKAIAEKRGEQSYGETV